MSTTQSDTEFVLMENDIASLVYNPTENELTAYNIEHRKKTPCSRKKFLEICEWARKTDEDFPIIINGIEMCHDDIPLVVETIMNYINSQDSIAEEPATRREALSKVIKKCAMN